MLLAGCCNPKVITKQETVKVEVPVLECPSSYTQAPPLQRPALISPLLTKADTSQPGRVVQACAIDSRQLLYYAQALEARVQMANAMCAAPSTDK